MGLNDAYNLLWLETQKEHKNNLTLNLTFLVPSAASNNFFCPSKHKAHTPKSPPHNLGSHPNPCSLLYTTFVWMRLVTGHYVTVEKGRTAQQMSALWKQPCCLTWSWQWPNHHTIIWPPEEACVGGGLAHMNMNGHHIITIWTEVSRSKGPHPKLCKCTQMIYMFKSETFQTKHVFLFPHTKARKTQQNYN